MRLTVLVPFLCRLVRGAAVKIGDACIDDINKCADVTDVALLKEECPCTGGGNTGEVLPEDVDAANPAACKPSTGTVGIGGYLSAGFRVCKKGSLCARLGLQKTDCPVSCGRVVLTTKQCRDKTDKKRLAVCTEQFDSKNKFLTGKYVDTRHCDEEICFKTQCYGRSEQAAKVKNKLKEVAVAQCLGAELLKTTAYHQAMQVMIKKNYHVSEVYWLDFFALYVLRFHWGVGGQLDEDPCGVNKRSWHGVECHKDRTVKAIDFGWEQICDLEGDVLLKNIPDAITLFRNLMKFEVPHNKLTGTLPQCLGNLKKLTHLNLGGNRLTGTLPASLFDLKHLQLVNLNNNQFSGTLSTDVRKLESLVAINLSENAFTGPLPNTLGALTSLLYFTARDTYFQGYCDEKLCKSLTRVTVNCNRVKDCGYCTNSGCYY